MRIRNTTVAELFNTMADLLELKERILSESGLIALLHTLFIVSQAMYLNYWKKARISQNFRE
jgi:hypothetical protein